MVRNSEDAIASRYRLYPVEEEENDVVEEVKGVLHTVPPEVTGRGTETYKFNVSRSAPNLALRHFLNSTYRRRRKGRGPVLCGASTIIQISHCHQALRVVECRAVGRRVCVAARGINWTGHTPVMGLIGIVKSGLWG